MLTVCVIRLRVVPACINQMVLGGWIFILLYRRVLFCLIFDIFKDAAICGDGELVHLRNRAVAEYFLPIRSRPRVDRQCRMMRMRAERE